MVDISKSRTTQAPATTPATPPTTAGARNMRCHYSGGVCYQQTCHLWTQLTDENEQPYGACIDIVVRENQLEFYASITQGLGQLAAMQGLGPLPFPTPDGEVEEESPAPAEG